jgi:iron complex transport system substrate-binding protein
MLPKLTDLRQTPKRIVCIAPSNTEILYALGAQDRIVGVSRYCDYPAEARELPRCGGFRDPTVTDILDLKPDLVLGQSFLQEDAVKALVHAEVAVMAFGATSLTQVLQEMLILGRIVEKENEANALVANLHAEFSAQAEKSEALRKQISRPPRAHLEEWGPSEPYYLAGDWAAQMLRIAGFDNAFDDRNLRCPSPERTVSAKEIASADPDLIIAAWCGCSDRMDLTRIAKRPELKESRVVQGGWLRQVDDRFVMRPGPRLPEGVNRLQKILEEWISAQ